MQANDGMKQCPSCGETKPVSEFWKNKASKDGYTTYCKPCFTLSTAANRARFIGKSIQKVSDGLVTEKRCPGCKRVLSLSAYTPHKAKTYGVSSRCRECMRAKEQQRRDRAKEQGSSVYRLYAEKLKLEVFQHYSGSPIPRCACCGTDYMPHLTLDHINRDGKKHRAQIGIMGGNPMYRWAKREGYPPIFQVLCFNCNVAMFREGACRCQDRP